MLTPVPGPLTADLLLVLFSQALSGNYFKNSKQILAANSHGQLFDFSYPASRFVSKFNF